MRTRNDAVGRWCKASKGAALAVTVIGWALCSGCTFIESLDRFLDRPAPNGGFTLGVGVDVMAVVESVSGTSRKLDLSYDGGVVLTADRPDSPELPFLLSDSLVHFNAGLKSLDMHVMAHQRDWGAVLLEMEARDKNQIPARAKSHAQTTVSAVQDSTPEG